MIGADVAGVLECAPRGDRVALATVISVNPFKTASSVRQSQRARKLAVHATHGTWPH